jgi:hypothetical protein
MQTYTTNLKYNALLQKYDTRVFLPKIIALLITICISLLKSHKKHNRMNPVYSIREVANLTEKETELKKEENKEKSATISERPVCS